MSNFFSVYIHNDSVNISKKTVILSECTGKHLNEAKVKDGHWQSSRKQKMNLSESAWNQETWQYLIS